MAVVTDPRRVLGRLLQGAVVAGLLAAVGPLSAQGHSLEIFALKYRTAEQMVALVRPLVPPPGSVSGIRNQLVVRTTPQNMAEIRMLLERVDTAPRRLLITVSQAVDRQGDTDRASVSGSVGTAAVGPHGEISIGTGHNRPGTSGLQVDVISSRGAEADRDMRQVQVLEGEPALIHTGQSIPVPSRQVRRGPYGAQVVDSVDYRDLATGFQVLARLSGDQVVLEIMPQRQIAGATGAGSVDSQMLATTVSGRLGEWIDLGGVTRTDDDRSSVTLGRTRQAGAEMRRVRVRVEELR